MSKGGWIGESGPTKTGNFNFIEKADDAYSTPCQPAITNYNDNAEIKIRLFCTI